MKPTLIVNTTCGNNDHNLSDDGPNDSRSTITVPSTRSPQSAPPERRSAERSRSRSSGGLTRRTRLQPLAAPTPPDGAPASSHDPFKPLQVSSTGLQGASLGVPARRSLRPALPYLPPFVEFSSSYRADRVTTGAYSRDVLSIHRASSAVKKASAGNHGRDGHINHSQLSRRRP